MSHVPSHFSQKLPTRLRYPNYQTRQRVSSPRQHASGSLPIKLANVSHVPANTSHVPANMSHIPANMSHVPANMSHVPGS